jgi:hypothetical protein
MSQAQIPNFIDVESERDTLAEEERRVEDDILREFNADGQEVEWRIVVKKIDDKTKKQETCCHITPDELPGLFEYLKNEYGPGSYRAYVIRNGVTKHNLGYSIAKPLARPAGASHESALVPQIARLIERQNEQIAQMTRGAPPAPAAPPFDPMAMMTSVLAALSQAKELFAPPPQSGGGGSTLKDFMEMWSVAQEMAQDRGGGSTAGEIFREFLKSPIAGELADAMRQQRVTGQRQAAVAAAASPVAAIAARGAPGAAPQMAMQYPAPSSAPIAENGGEGLPADLAELGDAEKAMLKGAVDYWVARADSGSNPGLYAELALDNYPVEVIRAVLLRPDLRQVAIGLNPRAAEQWDWFAEMIEEIRSLLTQAENDAHLGGDVQQPGSQAAASPPSVDPVRQGGGRGDAGDHDGIGEAGA